MGFLSSSHFWYPIYLFPSTCDICALLRQPITDPQFKSSLNHIVINFGSPRFFPVLCFGNLCCLIS